LARIYEILPLRCALCEGEMRLIAFVTDEPRLEPSRAMGYGWIAYPFTTLPTLFRA
jgi:hypothetical protein